MWKFHFSFYYLIFLKEEDGGFSEHFRFRHIWFPHYALCCKLAMFNNSYSCEEMVSSGDKVSFDETSSVHWVHYLTPSWNRVYRLWFMAKYFIRIHQLVNILYIVLTHSFTFNLIFFSLMLKNYLIRSIIITVYFDAFCYLFVCIHIYE